MSDLSSSGQQFGPGFLPTFLYYFISMLLITTLIAAQLLHLSIHSGIPLQLGVIAGLAAGLLGGLRNRTTTLNLPIQNRSTFTTRLAQTLADMGYQPVDPSTSSVPAGVLVYERSRLGRFLSGRVYVQLADTQAVVASRAATIQRLRSALT